MYSDLPEQLRRIVQEYLLADDFRTAKQIHDDWIARRQYANQDCLQTYAIAESY